MTIKSEFPAAASQAILGQYSRNPQDLAARRLRRLALIAANLFCLFYGAVFALFAPYALLPLSIPAVVLGLVVVWALPATRRPPVKTLEFLFFTFFVVLVLWPNYIGIKVPGLPWVTLARLTNTPLCACFLICLSTSAAFTREMFRGLRSLPVLAVLLAAFVVIQTVSIAFSDDVPHSLDRYIIAQTTWTPVCLIACYVFQKPGRVVRWAALLWVTAMVAGVVGVIEYRAHRVLWADHIPSFLQIHDPAVEQMLVMGTRAFTNIYRVSSTFGNSLDFAEFLAFVFPFVFHFMLQNFRWSIRILATISLPFLVFVAYITGARSGLLGFVICSLTYFLVWGISLRRKAPTRVLGSLLIYSYPAVAILGLAGVLAVGRLRKLLLGGAVQKSSTLARIEQYQKGIPLVMKRPFGYGIGRGGSTLDYHSPDGLLTIDTYYLLTALEYGVIGFIIFFSMIAVAIYESGHIFLSDTGGDQEVSFVAPVGIALINFFVIRSVFSQPDNLPIAYMLMGMIFALAYRAKRVQGDPAISGPAIRSVAART